MKVSFCTCNPNKVAELEAILKEVHPEILTKIEVDMANVELPELQGEPEHISKEKCRIAFQQTGHAVIVEDTSLGFDCLKGLPGPYIKWFFEKLRPEGLFQMVEGYENRGGFAMTIFGFWDGKTEEPILFTGVTQGTIVSPRGSTDFSWDPIFEPQGCDLTYAEMTKIQKNEISHRRKAADKLAEHLKALTI